MPLSPEVANLLAVLQQLTGNNLSSVELINLGHTKSGHWGFGCFNPNCLKVGEIVEIKFEDLNP